MNKIVEVVNWSFKNSQDCFKQSVEVQHIKADLVATLTNEQKQIFDKLMDSMNKLHKIDTEEYILHTHKVCKEAFKLRQWRHLWKK